MSATNRLGIRNNNVIVPYTAATKRTKQVDLTVTGTNWTTTRAVGIAYADSDGNWRLVFNARGTLSSTAASFAGSIAGVTFKTTSAITSYIEESGVAERNSLIQITASGYDYFLVSSASGNFNIVCASGDVELEEKPDWADANMEGVTAVDVLIPFGQTGMPGETLTHTFAATAASLSNTLFTVDSAYSLPAGKWLLQAQAIFVCGGVTSNTYFLADINTSAALRDAAIGGINLGTAAGTLDTCGAIEPLIVTNSVAQNIYAVGQYNYASIGTSSIKVKLTAIRLAPG